MRNVIEKKKVSELSWDVLSYIVETGRFVGVEEQDRLCHWRELNDVEDEMCLIWFIYLCYDYRKKATLVPIIYISVFKKRENILFVCKCLIILHIVISYYSFFKTVNSNIFYDVFSHFKYKK